MSNLLNNRIRTVLSAVDLSDFEQAITQINQVIDPFGIALTTKELQTVRTLNGVQKQLVALALREAQKHSDLFPAYLNLADIDSDFTLLTQLESWSNDLKTILGIIHDTKALAGYEALRGARKIYEHLETAYQSGIPGAEEAYKRLQPYFKKGKVGAKRHDKL